MEAREQKDCRMSLCARLQEVAWGEHEASAPYNGLKVGVWKGLVWMLVWIS